MFDDFIKAAVVGPTATRMLSMIGSCAECARNRSATGERSSCTGFGPGCFGTLGRESASDPAGHPARPGTR